MKGTQMRCQSNPDQHLTHQVDVVITPKINHYAKLVCVDCGGAWLQWLSHSDTQKLIGPQDKKKAKFKKKSTWSTTSKKERQHYQSYQPPKEIKRTQLIGDRLALRGRSQYNGNPIGSIPITELKTILRTRIDNPSDRQYIENYIEQISGPQPGPSHTI
jgi:hypothetical protein